MNTDKPAPTPDQLRARAKSIREQAAYADRRESARSELAWADELERKARELEGKATAATTTPTREPHPVSRCEGKGYIDRMAAERARRARHRRTGDQAITGHCFECGLWHNYWGKPEAKL